MKDNRPFSVIEAERRLEILDKLREVLKGNDDFWFSLVTADVSNLNQNYHDPYVKVGRHRLTGDTHAAFRLNYRDDYLVLIPENHRWPESIPEAPNRFKASTLTLPKLEEWLIYIRSLEIQEGIEQGVKQAKRDAARALFDSLEGDYKFEGNSRHFVVERQGLGLHIDRETGVLGLHPPFGSEAVLKVFRAIKSRESLNRIQDAFIAEYNHGDEDLEKLINGGF